MKVWRAQRTCFCDGIGTHFFEAKMLLAAVSVLVVVASGDPSDGSTPAMEQALRGALGRDVQVAVRSSPEGTTDETLVTAANSEHAALLVVVSWSDRPRRATLRIMKPSEGRWTDREIRFDAADVASERGRTVGFALASMMPDEALSPPAERQAATATAAAPSPASSSSAARIPPETAPPYVPGPNPLALEAVALAVAAPGGYGGGYGGVFAVRLPVGAGFAVRGAMSVRAGDVAPAQATSRVIVGGAGIAWQPWMDPRRRWALGARVDALLIHHDLGHLSQDDPEVAHLSRFLPGLDAALEGGYRFADRAAFVAAAGTEIALGTTDIVVREHKVASLTPARALLELGLRVSF
jgi:hypothetical protein